MAEWMRLATLRSVVQRALKYAAIVGTMLIAINHGDAILQGELAGPLYLKMGLTVCVPYLVSTLSSVAALRDR